MRHGHAPKTGISTTYRSWRHMHSRCYNQNVPEHKYYGARGIMVCARWHDFVNFLTDMGSRPAGLELDRINNNGNYEPSNCRWATRHEQIQNSRLAKLTVEDVLAMRKMRADTGISYEKVGALFGVRKNTAHRAITGRGWTNIK